VTVMGESKASSATCFAPSTDESLTKNKLGYIEMSAKNSRWLGLQTCLQFESTFVSQDWSAKCLCMLHYGT